MSSNKIREFFSLIGAALGGACREAGDREVTVTISGNDPAAVNQAIAELRANVEYEAIPVIITRHEAAK